MTFSNISCYGCHLDCQSFLVYTRNHPIHLSRKRQVRSVICCFRGERGEMVAPPLWNCSFWLTAVTTEGSGKMGKGNHPPCYRHKASYRKTMMLTFNQKLFLTSLFHDSPLNYSRTLKIWASSRAFVNQGFPVGRWKSKACRGCGISSE